MTIASLADVKSKLSAYVKASSDSPVVITRNGKAVAAIVPVENDEDVERLMLGYSPKLQSILASASKRIQEGKKVPHREFWSKVRARHRRKSK